MGFINKKAHNVRHDRFDRVEVKKEVLNKKIEPEIIKPIEIQTMEVPTDVLTAFDTVEVVAFEETIEEQPKPKKKKKSTKIEEENKETKIEG